MQSTNDDGNTKAPGFTVSGATTNMYYYNNASMGNGVYVVKYGIFIVKATSTTITTSHNARIAQISV